MRSFHDFHSVFIGYKGHLLEQLSNGVQQIVRLFLGQNPQACGGFEHQRSLRPVFLGYFFFGQF